MASIFTFDPDPPCVSSPWSTPRAGTPAARTSVAVSTLPSRPPNDRSASLQVPHAAFTDAEITHLEAEPQEGPTEYKLHLLLRPRRLFSRISTQRPGTSSTRSKAGALTPSASPGRSVSHAAVGGTPPASSSAHGRQHRLEQLTTQLLWRLQQSSPYHSSTANTLVLPQLPEADAHLRSPTVPQRLLPGLEESKGALYEIGVADDGTFVGLAEDEMEESLNNLRAMAASLGCTVEVLRMVPVGECEWLEDVASGNETNTRLRQGKLWVAEAYVKPDLGLVKVDSPDDGEELSGRSRTLPATGSPSSQNEVDSICSPTEQLRVSFTGATMSGKSSLLGTLSFVTLDSGRGKSRLGLFKHRHEITSGMTSSITQELIGYRDVRDGASGDTAVQAVNYASGNVSSWNDIHAACESCRLVLVTDTAGHPRYRRTTVRGLVGWSPHWTFLCIPAQSVDDVALLGPSASAQDLPNLAAAEVDLSHAHLQLCLALDLPIVVVITKLDLASKSGLRQTLSRLFSVLKSAGKKPRILPDTGSSTVIEDELMEISPTDLAEVRNITESLEENPTGVVPVILTSAVKGTGITKLHALLRLLPIPPPSKPLEQDEDKIPPTTLFHIEEVYAALNPGKADISPSLLHQDHHEYQGCVISGHLRYGTLHLNDELLLGPYPVDSNQRVESMNTSGNPGSHTNSPLNRSLRPPPADPLTTSRSFPGTLSKAASGRPQGLEDSNSAQHEWRKVRVVSIRNLRLPVRCLHAGQVSTVGVVPIGSVPISTPAIVRVRKGMVLANGTPNARKGFVLRFEGDEAAAVIGLTVGSAVVVYVASVRASATVVSVCVEEPDIGDSHSDDGFGFGFDEDDAEKEQGQMATLVAFRFMYCNEFIEFGIKALVMPGGGSPLYGGMERGEKGVAGLEGFVGMVVEDLA